MLIEEKEKRAQCLSKRLGEIIEHKSPFASAINNKQQVGPQKKKNLSNKKITACLVGVEIKK